MLIDFKLSSRSKIYFFMPSAVLSLFWVSWLSYPCNCPMTFVYASSWDYTSVRDFCVDFSSFVCSLFFSKFSFACFASLRLISLLCFFSFSAKCLASSYCFCNFSYCSFRCSATAAFIFVAYRSFYRSSISSASCYFSYSTAYCCYSVSVISLVMLSLSFLASASAYS